jgi:nitrogenase molybdenum-iron protein NifN
MNINKNLPDPGGNMNLTTNPLRLSQPAGAALAFLGIEKTIPLWHGVQGCSAFGKILFIQHFREPIPFQNSALTQTSVVMGSEDNAMEALENLSEKAELIGMLTTGVAETSGVDLLQIEKEFELNNQRTRLVTVAAPDFEGTLQTGYEKACDAVLDKLVQPTPESKSDKVLVMPGPYTTPAEVDLLKDIFDDFGFNAVVFPDLGDSLGGFLHREHYSHTTTGGTPLESIEELASSSWIVTIGQSMQHLGDKFSKNHQMKHSHFDHLSSIEILDRFFLEMEKMSGVSMPARYRKQRRHLQDCLLDTQFYLNGKAAAVAGDPEFVIRWQQPLLQAGMEVQILSSIKHKDMPVGDLKVLEKTLAEAPVELLVGNTHIAELAQNEELAFVRAGMPVHDRIGEPQKVRIGYQGTAQLLMECANALMDNESQTKAYRSPLQESLLKKGA